jgi:hypothetical protein
MGKGKPREGTYEESNKTSWASKHKTTTQMGRGEPGLYTAR